MCQLCTHLYLLCLQVEQLEIIQKDQTKQVTHTKCWLLTDSAQPSLLSLPTGTTLSACELFTVRTQPWLWVSGHLHPQGRGYELGSQPVTCPLTLVPATWHGFSHAPWQHMQQGAARSIQGSSV